MKNIKKHLRKLGVSIALVGTLGAGLFYASLRNSAEDSLSRPLVSSSLRKEFKNKFGISLEGRISKIEDTYFDKSTEFLTRYTNSIFADAVWTRRAEIFKGYQEKGSGREDIYLAIEEFRNALEAPYKSDYYVFALKNLADIYRNIIRDKGTTEAFDLAVKEYYRRYQNADLSLPRLGVNDFLEVKGINLN